MLYLCHDFYPRLETVNITPRFLAGLKNGHSSPEAREVWKAVQSEGLKQGGIQKVNEMLSLKEFKMEEVEAPAYNLPPAQKMEQTVKAGTLPAAKDQNALNLGFYELSKEEQKYLSENNNDLLLIFERVQAAGHQILFALRERAGLKRSERNPASGHEEKLVFMPTQKAFEKAIKDNREGIELLRIISGRGDMDPKPAEDAAFLAMHLNYKGNWEFRAFSDEQINLMREMRKHSAGLQHYSDSPWDRLRREKIFAQWPLKSYLPEMKKLRELTQAYWASKESVSYKTRLLNTFFGQQDISSVVEKIKTIKETRLNADDLANNAKILNNINENLGALINNLKNETNRKTVLEKITDHITKNPQDMNRELFNFLEKQKIMGSSTNTIISTNEGVVETNKKPTAKPLDSLEKSFRNILVPDLLNFLKDHPEYTLYFSETLRSKEEQVDILVKKWKDNTLTGTYKHELYPAMAKKAKTEEAKNHIHSIKTTDPALAKAAEDFFNNPTESNARKVFENIVTENSSRHIRGAAMDISGSWNKDHKFKKALVEYLNNTRKYTMFLYINNSTKYTAANGVYKVYRTEQVIPPNEVFTNLAKDTNWFFHVEQYRASV